MSSSSTKPVLPNDVLKLTKPTPSYLCPLTANQYNIQFLQFKIKDATNNKIMFETSAEEVAKEIAKQGFVDEDSLRCIKYTFNKEVLKSKTVSTTLVFSVGDKPVKNFRMVERHYFRDRLLKSFDFNFPFCIPNTTNSWECIYTMPQLSDKEVKDIVNNPYEVKSDSFYFVENELVMHNKALYAYK